MTLKNFRAMRPWLQFTFVLLAVEAFLVAIVRLIAPEFFRLALAGGAVVVLAGLISSGGEWALRGSKIAEWFVGRAKHE